MKKYLKNEIPDANDVVECFELYKKLSKAEQEQIRWIMFGMNLARETQPA